MYTRVEPLRFRAYKFARTRLNLVRAAKRRLLNIEDILGSLLPGVESGAPDFWSAAVSCHHWMVIGHF